MRNLDEPEFFSNLTSVKYSHGLVIARLKQKEKIWKTKLYSLSPRETGGTVKTFIQPQNNYRNTQIVKIVAGFTILTCLRR